ncbi:hypothetical protein M409DRAFT_27322 [Zasmidium cellare ATCC 36951]|uniref:Beta-lactamase-related domain-containing protein n=1 Tax=Zasmidium cellare ATCC 36951 TaxID=1080233 RepID=A0A6A6C7U3_ZASCE|nr:uncharacterized protein M409DRAFT_27322 [Zasmidium cellare ATCC 36951]KAF2162318.1 hypothetical protein M409DRAFT_27322 [Zasmidium cellare ATCC 36951]
MADRSTTLHYSDFNDPSLDTFIAKTMREFPTPGLAVLVIHGDQIRAKGYGYSNLQTRTPITPSTLFFTGSTTKSFTASLAAHLVESQDHPSITWETPLAEMIRDDFVLDQTTPRGPWATATVTMEDCLSHRTGLPRHDLAWVNGFEEIGEVVRRLRYLPLHRDMRTKFEYSNNPYTAVSYAIEKVLDCPFKDSLKQHIFDPLEMHDTTYDIEDARKVVKEHEIDLATGYLWNSETHDYEQVPWTDIPPSRGAGGIISNVLDYAKWVRHLMKPTNLNAALSENAVKAIRTPKMLIEPEKPFTGPQAYGLGLFSRVYQGREVIEHAGAIAGYMANMVMVPPSATEIERGEKDSGWAVVTMINAYSVAQDVVCWHLLDEFLGTPGSERYDVAEEMRKKQAKAQESLEPDKVVEKLFGASAQDSHLEPRLPIAAYEGVYEHPGYRQIQVSARPIRIWNSSDTPERSGATEQDRGQNETPLLYLAPPASAKAYISRVGTLHHVNGEHWWSHQTTGPSSWFSDKALKVQFVIGANGKVERMRYQAEPDMADELAFFEKIE